MANRMTDAHRIVTVFADLPLEKAEMLLEVAASIMKNRRAQQGKPLDKFKPAPEQPRGALKRLRVSELGSTGTLPDTDRT